MSENNLSYYINNLICSDNLSIMKSLPNQCIDLIYIDPPFFSGKNYTGDDATKEFTDTWCGGLTEYLDFMCVRFHEMRRLLKPTGSIFVHVDWHAVHYLKVELDKIFGYNNFQNEIIWTYKSGGATQKRFSRKHDTILFYSRSSSYTFNPQYEKSYNRDFKSYGFKDVKQHKDKFGWYTIVNMKDVWNINMVGRTSYERNGYPTQKPEKLLERIIVSCTNRGDVVADFFCGSGTTLAVAQNLNRNWIGCDVSDAAIQLSSDRLFVSKV